ncbi:MAG: InlB B-repeat-containing protein, partial [Christensenellales bacterium]
MADKKGGTERKNLLIKTLLIVILLLLALLSTVFYVYAYPKATITLYSICGNNQEKESTFQIKKYSPLGAIKPVEKFGYKFLYWSYDIGGNEVIDTEREVDVDYLDLFGMYELKEYNIRLWIQEHHDDPDQDKPVLYMTYENVKYNSTLTLPTGLDSNGVLIPQLSARTGYHFVGWTTKVKEEEVIASEDVTLAGGTFYALQDSDVDLYAYWEKNEYDVVTHTGNEYLMIDGVPMRDADGNFVIRNNRVQQTKPIKYLNSLTTITDYVKAELSDIDGMINAEGINIEDYKEYEFVGWYLDEELTIPADAEKMTVMVKIIDGKEVPYLSYLDDETRNFNSTYNEITNTYEFHLYSKWQRKSYTLSFNKNSTGSNGKIASITVYKYDEHYGKFYQTAEFTRANENTEFFNKLDLSSYEITTESFLSSNSGYRFIGWSTTPKTTAENSVVYYRWVQDDVTTNNQQYYYVDKEYTHTVSEDVTLYAQWARIRYVTFR